MNKFNKFILMLFSIIIFIVSIFLILVFNYVIPVEDVTRILEICISTSESAPFIWTLVLSMLSLFSLAAIFVPSDDDENKKGIKIKYDKGILYLSKDTFENLALSCAKNQKGISNAKAQVVFSKDGILINIYAYVFQDVVVSDLTFKLQKEIEETIVKCTTAKVKGVNLKVKGIVTKNTEK